MGLPRKRSADTIEEQLRLIWEDTCAEKLGISFTEWMAPGPRQFRLFLDVSPTEADTLAEARGV